MSYGTDLMLEAASENLFLTKFYTDPVRFAFPTQLYFLLQRVQQLLEFRQDDLFRSVYIADYMLEKDRLFAQLTLDQSEFELYCLVYDRVVETVPQPDLVIYLQAPVSTLARRIERRGLSYEQDIDQDYLARLATAYIKFFHRYDRSPLLIIDTDRVNFADDDEHYRLLLERMQEGVTGRQYFNPRSFPG
jgi:deoxyguanosine kinase